MRIAKRKKLIIFTFIALIAILVFYLKIKTINSNLLRLYDEKKSFEIKDACNETMKIYQNKEGNYSLRRQNYPQKLEELVVKKEDKYFYCHPGINPVSSVRAIKNYISGEKAPTASTISQQLVKILLGNIGERTIKNKLKEITYAFGLELSSKKKEILNMYLNTVFLGNNIEGFNTAALFYFGKDIETLNQTELLQLLASLSEPSGANPFYVKNKTVTLALASRLDVDIDESKISVLDKEKTTEKFNNLIMSETSFEIENIGINPGICGHTTIDNEISLKTREIIKSTVLRLFKDKAYNAAAVIIAMPQTNEQNNRLIALVGSPDPSVDAFGYKINMAIKPRAIGSTIKPFIYAKAFEAGLRPYTLIEDREYKYTIGTGFAFYPKNYDYEYRGLVNLHYALSNSLNVPTVKVLEYIGLDNFYNFILKDLSFIPVQELENYQLGIALGEMEMDLLSLAHYYTIFVNDGVLKPLQICPDFCLNNSGNICGKEKHIIDNDYIQLINKILTDRQTGIEEFGIKSDFNLPYSNYAVKTGTSREFHDSWTVGYTPNFVVGVWVGNAQDEPMEKISGQAGAGRIWHDVMNLLYDTDYNRNDEFKFSKLKEYKEADTINIGLGEDNYELIKNLILDDALILSPHDADEFLLEDDMSVPLISREEADWLMNGESVGQGQNIFLKLKEAGVYEIEASSNSRSETITIFVNSE